MSDLFYNVILCKECGRKMLKEMIERNGVLLRSAACRNCSRREFHPLDLARHKEFVELRRKSFHVKLRFVGNSYAVSIPREIIDFINAREELVEMQLEEFGKLALIFKNSVEEHEREVRKRFKLNSF